MTKSVQDTLKQENQVLVAAGVQCATRDLRLLMAFTLGVQPYQISLLLNNVLDPSQQAIFDQVCAKRAARMPMSHILGYRDFYEHRFIVTPDVLDPRPETESLVSLAFEEDFMTVLDLGTGSGCILLSLLANRRLSRGVGVDQSPKAISIAQRNAAKLHLSKQVDFFVSDWFSSVPITKFDLIVSNPPYIHPNAMADLSLEVLHEPEFALTDYSDGLSHYRQIAKSAHNFLAPNGRLLFEIGFDQGPAVSAILFDHQFRDITVLPDLDNCPRVVACRSSHQ